MACGSPASGPGGSSCRCTRAATAGPTTISSRCSTRTVVAVDTDAGLTGWGEVCPLGPAYLPAYANGARTGIAEIGAGADRPRPARARRGSTCVMDQTLKGHPYVKSAIDMACWDLLGKAAGLPVCTLLGGRFGDDFALYRAISQEAPDAMAAKVAGYRAEGYRKFQLKVGGEVEADIARIRACAASARARRRAGRRRQHRLDHARGGAGVRRGARRRRLHRAALRRPTRPA